MTNAPDHPLRLRGIPSIEVRDADRYVGYVEQLRLDTQLVRSDGDFEFSGQFMALEGFGISVGHWGCRAVLRGDMWGHTVSFPLRGGASVIGHGRVEHQQRGLILGMGASEVDIVFEPRFSTIALTFDPGLLRAHLQELVGVDRVELALEPNIDLNSGSGLYLQRLAQFLVAEIERRPADLASPRTFAALRESFIHTLLATQLRSLALERPTPDVGQRRIQALEGYIEEHLDEPLPLGELASHVGVSVRAVQLAFERYRGLSPSKFIHERRLERAARLLRSGDESTTVLEVALDCGFNHTGRFARSYCERFGELPSETLRHGPRRVPPSSLTHSHSRRSTSV